MRGINATDSRTVAEVRKALLQRYEAARPRSWRAVASALGVKSDALLARVAAGKQKPPDSVLIALGFEPVRVVELHAGYDVAPVCKTCGCVHTTKTCTAKRARRSRRLHQMTARELRAAFEERHAA